MFHNSSTLCPVLATQSECRIYFLMIPKRHIKYDFRYIKASSVYSIFTSLIFYLCVGLHN